MHIGAEGAEHGKERLRSNAYQCIERHWEAHVLTGGVNRCSRMHREAEQRFSGQGRRISLAQLAGDQELSRCPLDSDEALRGHSRCVTRTTELAVDKQSSIRPLGARPA